MDPQQGPPPFDPATEHPHHQDLLGFIWHKWCQSNPGVAPETPLGRIVGEYIAFARETLQKNQPVGIDYLGKGISLRLQDGTVLSLTGDGSEMHEPNSGPGDTGIVVPIPPGPADSQQITKQGDTGGTARTVSQGIHGNH